MPLSANNIDIHISLRSIPSCSES